MTLALTAAGLSVFASTAALAADTARLDVSIISVDKEIGLTYALTNNDQRLLALVTDDENRVTGIGLATSESVGDTEILFANVEAANGSGVLELTEASGVLKIMGATHAIDPRILAAQMADADVGELVGDMIAKAEGDTLTFGSTALFGADKDVTLRMVQIAGHTFGVAKIEERTFVTQLARVGQTYVSVGAVGTFDPETRMVTDVGDLATLGLSGASKTTRRDTPVTLATAPAAGTERLAAAAA